MCVCGGGGGHWTRDTSEPSFLFDTLEIPKVTQNNDVVVDDGGDCTCALGDVTAAINSIREFKAVK